MDLLFKLTLWSKVLVCYMCLGSNGYFITDATLIGKSLQDIYYYCMDHLRSNLVGPLVLGMVVYNGWGTDIVLQVLQDSINSIENG
jgi:hypothetical protein